MEERKNRTIIKSSNPKELKVWQASSLDDQIRFYLNDTQYIAATEMNDGEIWVEIGENVEKKANKKNNLMSKKIFIAILGITMLLCVEIILLGLYISCLINNLYIGMFFINIMMYLIGIVDVILIEFKRVTATIRSKHSAEHMMVNFLEINNRLPKSMEEIRAYSRFSVKCGTRKDAESIVQVFIALMLTEIMTFIICGVLYYFFNNITLERIIMSLAFFFIIFIVYIRMKKMQFVIAPITSVLSNLMQCANTTKNVEDNDILLAYCAAKYWMQEVYPEFYNEEDDVFLDNYDEVNKREVDN